MNLGIRSRVTQCEGKRPYATRKDAVKWRRKMRALAAYRCPHCGQFHLGTRPKDARSLRRRQSNWSSDMSLKIEALPQLTAFSSPIKGETGERILSQHRRAKTTAALVAGVKATARTTDRRVQGYLDMIAGRHP